MNATRPQACVPTAARSAAPARDAGADRAQAACLSASFTDDRGGASLVLALAAVEVRDQPRELP